MSMQQSEMAQRKMAQRKKPENRNIRRKRGDDQIE